MTISSSDNRRLEVFRWASGVADHVHLRPQHVRFVQYTGATIGDAGYEKDLLSLKAILEKQ